MGAEADAQEFHSLRIVRRDGQLHLGSIRPPDPLQAAGQPPRWTTGAMQAMPAGWGRRN